MKSSISIGVDIGGSHICCQAFDFVNMIQIENSLFRNAVDSKSDAESILTAWTDCLQQCIQSVGGKNIAGIGFAMPGPFDYKNGIALFQGVEKFDSLYGINVVDELKQRLQLDTTIDIRFLNDAACFAIGEAWLGAAKGVHKSIILTLGTGFGSAFVVNGIPVDSGKGVADEGCLYYLPFGDSNADSHFSTRWFLAAYKRKFEKEIDGVKELMELASTQPEVKMIFEEFGANLGRFLRPYLINFECDCVVLGGNIAKTLALFAPAMDKELQGLRCKAVLSELFEDAAIAGSARLIDAEFYSKIALNSNK